MRQMIATYTLTTLSLVLPHGLCQDQARIRCSYNRTEEGPISNLSIGSRRTWLAPLVLDRVFVIGGVNTTPVAYNALSMV